MHCEEDRTLNFNSPPKFSLIWHRLLHSNPHVFFGPAPLDRHPNRPRRRMPVASANAPHRVVFELTTSISTRAKSSRMMSLVKISRVPVRQSNREAHRSRRTNYSHLCSLHSLAVAPTRQATQSPLAPLN